MKFYRLAPIGLALFLALPLAAQTVEKKSAPVPVVKKQHKAKPAKPQTDVDADDDDLDYSTVPTPPPTPPVPPVPPTPPIPPTPPRTMVDGDDIVIETPIAADGIDSNDIVVESPDDLRNIRIDSLDNVLRVRITKDSHSRAALEREMQQVSEDLRKKNHDLFKMRIEMNGDTTAIARALEEAQKALDSAHLSVLKLDSNMIFIRQMRHFPMAAFNGDSTWTSNSHGCWKAFTDSMLKDGKWYGASGYAQIPSNNQVRQYTYQYNDSLGQRAKKMVIVNTITRSDSVAGVSPDDPFRMLATDEAGLRMFFNNDSSVKTMSVFSRGKVKTTTVTVQMGDSTGRHNANTIIQSFTHCRNGNDSSQVFAMITVDGNGQPFEVLNNRVVVGKDSLRIIDGKDKQMIIRVDRDFDTPNGHSHVLIITATRNANLPPAASNEQKPEEMAKSTNTASATNGYSLEANTPNPFGESTTIAFTLPKPEHALLTVFDANGTPVKVLKDEELPAGTHSVVFDASGLPSGIYLYRLVAGNFSEAKTMTVTK